MRRNKAPTETFERRAVESVQDRHEVLEEMSGLPPARFGRRWKTAATE
jgi:hypothetical protein